MTSTDTSSSPIHIIDLIRKKRDKRALSEREIGFTGLPARGGQRERAFRAAFGVAHGGLAEWAGAGRDSRADGGDAGFGSEVFAGGAGQGCGR